MRGDEIRDHIPLRSQRLVGGADLMNGAVGHHQLLRDHVVRGRAVNRDARAGRIVRDHAADGGARAGGDVRAETKSVRLEKGVELIEDNAGAGADGARFEIQIGDLAVVAREFDDQSVADRAAGQTGARAARSHGNAGIRRSRDD